MNFEALNETYELIDMEDGEISEPGPSGAKKGPKSEKPKAKKALPSTETSKKNLTVYEIVHEAIENIGVSRKGASLQAIKKYVHSKSEMEENKLNTKIKKALLQGIENGTFKKPLNQAGRGVAGSFLLVKLKTKQTKTLAKKLVVDEPSSPDNIEKDSLHSETNSETEEELKYDFSDSDIEDIDDEEEETPNLKSQKLPKANVKKVIAVNKMVALSIEEPKASRTKKINNEEAKASGTKKVNEEAKTTRTKKVNKEEAKASGTKKASNEEAKASRIKKVKEEAKASGAKKASNEEAKASRMKKVNNEETKGNGTNKANEEEAKASGTKKGNKEEAKASGSKKVNKEEAKARGTKMFITERNEARERADSSDSEVVVKKTGRKSMKAYSSDTDVDFVELQDVHAPPKKTKVQAKGGKATAVVKQSKPKTVKLYNEEANENNVKSGKTRPKKKT